MSQRLKLFPISFFILTTLKKMSYTSLPLNFKRKMMKKDLSKQSLYDGVKQLVESTDEHLHLAQPKLYTLFSVAFQYLLFKASKEKGHYILRVEDGQMADKLARRAKDASSRKFMYTLLHNRRMKFKNSVIYLDFFNPKSWTFSQDIPENALKLAVIIKNTSDRPMDPTFDSEGATEGPEVPQAVEEVDLPKDFYYTSLKEVAKETIIVAFEQAFESVKNIEFPFIEIEKKKTIGGVTLSEKLDWDKIED
jgi:hypothetical protein